VPPNRAAEHFAAGKARFFDGAEQGRPDLTLDEVVGAMISKVSRCAKPGEYR
jgi:hypothetical protein